MMIAFLAALYLPLANQKRPMPINRATKAEGEMNSSISLVMTSAFSF